MKEEVVSEVYLVRVYRRGKGVLVGKVEEVGGEKRQGSFRTGEELVCFMMRKSHKERRKKEKRRQG